LDRNPSVYRARSSTFEIERERSGLIHTDGEPWQAGTTVSVKVHPKCLSILVPPN
jgi:diacylglycerol kinase family enzyme